MTGVAYIGQDIINKCHRVIEMNLYKSKTAHERWLQILQRLLST